MLLYIQDSKELESINVIVYKTVKNQKVLMLLYIQESKELKSNNVIVYKTVKNQKGRKREV